MELIFAANFLVLISMAFLLLGILLMGIIISKKGSDPFGKPPINPLLFRLGKGAMMICWTLICVQVFINIRLIDLHPAIVLFSAVFFLLGVKITLASFFLLGKSTRIGIPEEKTDLKVGGLYRFSRNPMYLGMFITIISSVIFTANPFVLAFGILSFYVHHRIVLSEEKFLHKRFGHSYENYCRTVRRYI